ncbi:hypothetical protein ACFQYP_23140 [Nonomuraea antimicrobica]
MSLRPQFSIVTGKPVCGAAACPPGRAGSWAAGAGAQAASDRAATRTSNFLMIRLPP